MKLLEYQAKEQFAAAGIPVPKGQLAHTAEEAARAASELGTVAIKAQVPVGGRGKAGGIAVVSSTAEAQREAARILAMSIGGFPVHSVWCEQAVDIGTELYLGITLDRERRNMVMMFSAAGGMEIEQIAETTPDQIAKLWPDPFAGPQPFAIRRLVFPSLRGSSHLSANAGPLAVQLVRIARALYDVAMSLDTVTCEINPLVVTSEGQYIAADGKLEIDENAHLRHGLLIESLQAASGGSDGSQSGDDPYEAEARRRGLTYVHLNGYVGCIGNGAGLVMNTLDLVKQQGGEPACFLDVGGGARADLVRNALDMVLLDPAVRGVFINIFGGITRCDEVAQGIITARDELHITKPLVVRMTGTREEEGRRLLQDAGITPGVNATEAAQSIVALTHDAVSPGRVA